jgi:hypothetical protein
MQRRSDKHGPHADEQLKHETEGLVRSGHGTHAEGWKEPEPTAPDPNEQNYPDPRAPGTPAGLTPTDVELRSRLAAAVQPLEFPANRDAVLALLRDADAPAELIDRASQLPAGRFYQNLAEMFDDLDLNERERF